MDVILQPAVVSALVAAFVTLLAPWIGARIKRAENGRIGVTALEAKRLDATEQRLKDMLDRQTSEIQVLRTRLDDQEKRTKEAEGREGRALLRYHRVLATLSDAAKELRDELEDDHRLEIAQRMVKAIQQARDMFDRKESA